MISHQHRVIFIHVPKAAGTSVEAALGHHGEDGPQRGSQDHRTLRQLQWAHLRPQSLSTLENCREIAHGLKGRLQPASHPAHRVTVTRAQFAAYFKFAIVRNPWARAYSWYRNVLPDPGHRDKLGVREDITFAEFLDRFAGTGLLRPQTYWLHDFRGRIGVDHVCRFENLPHDYAEVARRAGLPDAPLPHLNRGAVDADYTEAYDDRTRRLVADRYRSVIDLFNYTFTDGAEAGSAS